MGCNSGPTVPAAASGWLSSQSSGSARAVQALRRPDARQCAPATPLESPRAAAGGSAQREQRRSLHVASTRATPRGQRSVDLVVEWVARTLQCSTSRQMVFGVISSAHRCSTGRLKLNLSPGRGETAECVLCALRGLASAGCASRLRSPHSHSRLRTLDYSCDYSTIRARHGARRPKARSPTCDAGAGRARGRGIRGANEIVSST